MFKKKSVKNVIIAILCQIMTLVWGFLIPRIVVTSVGSEANGFLQTINEVYVYIALIESGLGLALLNSLYKPINKKDNEEISGLLSAAKKKYRTTAVIYLTASVFVGIIYPLFLHTELSYIEMSSSIIVYGIGGAGTMFLSSYITQYLIASGHSYFKEVIHFIIFALTSLSKITLIIMTHSVFWVCLSHSLLCVVEGLIYVTIFRRKFAHINLNCKSVISEPLKEQKYFWVHQVSSAVFGSTDLFVISIFCSLKDASVYAIYAMLFNAVSTIMNAIFNSLKYLLGDAYAISLKSYKKTHDIFDAVYLSAMFAFLWVVFSISTDFIGIYMKGADINYIDPYFPILFVLVKILSCCRNVCNNTHNIAHRAKNNIIPTVLEAVINLSVSIIMVKSLGVYGVLIGTIVALLFRTNQTIIYTNRYILNRSSFHTYKYIIVYSTAFLVLTFLKSMIIPEQLVGIKYVVSIGLILTIISMIIYGGLCVAMNSDVRKMICKKVKIRHR